VIVIADAVDCARYGGCSGGRKDATIFIVLRELEVVIPPEGRRCEGRGEEVGRREEGLVRRRHGE
jgi:hypothetical protein